MNNSTVHVLEKLLGAALGLCALISLGISISYGNAPDAAEKYWTTFVAASQDFGPLG